MTADLSALQDRIISDAAKSHPSLVRGQVWCRSCGATRRVNSSHALRNGWPKCCDATMTIDSPEEQAILRAKQGEV